MNGPTIEHVVLVNEADEAIGTMEKLSAHSSQTPLHRAFSLFIFNSKGEVLLQQRAFSKKTWPGEWSGSCCGHPGPGEERIDALRRRTKEELGMDLGHVVTVSPYRYLFEKNGIMENEICPIYATKTDDVPILNPLEVAAVRYVEWGAFLDEIKTHPGRYSPWCEEEALIIDMLTKGKPLSFFQSENSKLS